MPVAAIVGRCGLLVHRLGCGLRSPAFLTKPWPLDDRMSVGSLMAVGIKAQRPLERVGALLILVVPARYQVEFAGLSDAARSLFPGRGITG